MSLFNTLVLQQGFKYCFIDPTLVPGNLSDEIGIYSVTIHVSILKCCVVYMSCSFYLCGLIVTCVKIIKKKNKNHIVFKIEAFIFNFYLICSKM